MRGVCLLGHSRAGMDGASTCMAQPYRLKRLQLQLRSSLQAWAIAFDNRLFVLFWTSTASRELLARLCGARPMRDD
jgi:hypothetical protein